MKLTKTRLSLLGYSAFFILYFILSLIQDNSISDEQLVTISGILNSEPVFNDDKNNKYVRFYLREYENTIFSIEDNAYYAIDRTSFAQNISIGDSISIKIKKEVINEAFEPINDKALVYSLIGRKIQYLNPSTYNLLVMKDKSMWYGFFVLGVFTLMYALISKKPNYKVFLKAIIITSILTIYFVWLF